MSQPHRPLLLLLLLAAAAGAGEAPRLNITLDNVPLTPDKAKERAARLEAIQKRTRELTRERGNEPAAIAAIEAEFAYLIQSAPRGEDRLHMLRLLATAKWLRQLEVADRDGARRLLRMPEPLRWKFPQGFPRDDLNKAIDDFLRRQAALRAARDAFPADEHLPRAEHLQLCLRGRAFRDVLRDRVKPTLGLILDAPLAWAADTYLTLTATVTATQMQRLDKQQAEKLEQAAKLAAARDTLTARAAFDAAARLRPLGARAYLERIAAELQWGARISLDPADTRRGKSARLLAALLSLDADDPHATVARALIVLHALGVAPDQLDAAARRRSEHLASIGARDPEFRGVLLDLRSRLNARLGRPERALADRAARAEHYAALILALREARPKDAARALENMARANECNLGQLQLGIATPDDLVEALRLLAIPGIRQLEPPPPVLARVVENLRAHQRKSMAAVPKGELTMGGSGDTNERPARRVALDAFAILATEVSVEDYERFLREAANGYVGLPPHLAPHRANLTPLAWDQQLENKKAPVRGVNWFGAAAYAYWQALDLPTEAQWEFAARGREGRAFPWGKDPAVARRLTGHQPLSVDADTPDKTPDGVRHLGGNVAEWCRDTYDAGFYRKAPPANPINTGPGMLRSVRGASHRASKPFQFRAARRSGRPPLERFLDVGFRLVLQP